MYVRSFEMVAANMTPTELHVLAEAVMIVPDERSPAQRAVVADFLAAAEVMLPANTADLSAADDAHSGWPVTSRSSHRNKV